MMDVDPHREALFNDLYDNEHLPLALPRSDNAVRYRTETALRLRLQGRAHRPAEVEAGERHLGHWALQAEVGPLAPSWISSSGK
jgi:hypothetical protein